MRVLAHFQDFDFTSLEFNILDRHLLLRHNLDSYLFAGLLVDTGLNETEFTLSESLLDLVEIEKTGVADDLLDGFNPIVFVFLVT